MTTYSPLARSYSSLSFSMTWCLGCQGITLHWLSLFLHGNLHTEKEVNNAAFVLCPVHLSIKMLKETFKAVTNHSLRTFWEVQQSHLWNKIKVYSCIKYCGGQDCFKLGTEVVFTNILIYIKRWSSHVYGHPLVLSIPKN